LFADILHNEINRRKKNEWPNSWGNQQKSLSGHKTAFNLLAIKFYEGLYIFAHCLLLKLELERFSRGRFAESDARHLNMFFKIQATIFLSFN